MSIINSESDEYNCGRDFVGCSTNTNMSSSTASTSTPSDIANGVQDGPVQPRNHKFPSTKFGDRLQTFNPLWFDSSSWLEYSILKDAVFCCACHFFSTGQHRDENSFVTSGFRNWKNAPGKGGRLEKHNISERHQHAMSTWSEYTANISHNRSIGSILNRERQEQVIKNRH